MGTKNNSFRIFTVFFRIYFNLLKSKLCIFIIFKSKNLDFNMLQIFIVKK